MLLLRLRQPTLMLTLTSTITMNSRVTLVNDYVRCTVH